MSFCILKLSKCSVEHLQSENKTPFKSLTLPTALYWGSALCTCFGVSSHLLPNPQRQLHAQPCQVFPLANQAGPEVSPLQEAFPDYQAEQSLAHLHPSQTLGPFISVVHDQENTHLFLLGLDLKGCFLVWFRSWCGWPCMILYMNSESKCPGGNWSFKPPVSSALNDEDGGGDNFLACVSWFTIPGHSKTTPMLLRQLKKWSKDFAVTLDQHPFQSS